MLTAIDHIEIIVRDLDAYVAYLEKLGFEVLTRTSHHGESAELKLPGDNQPIFELHEVGGEEVIGINHIAFRTDDVNTAYDSLAKTDIRIDEPAPRRRLDRAHQHQPARSRRLARPDRRRQPQETGLG